MATKGHYGCGLDGKGDIGKALEEGSMTYTQEKIDDRSSQNAVRFSRLPDAMVGACLLKGSLIRH